MTSPWAISPHFYHTIFSKYTLNTYIPLSSGHLSLSSSLLHPPWLCLSLKPLLSAARTRSRSSALRVCVCFYFILIFFHWLPGLICSSPPTVEGLPPKASIAPQHCQFRLPRYLGSYTSLRLFRRSDCIPFAILFPLPSSVHRLLDNSIDSIEPG